MCSFSFPADFLKCPRPLQNHSQIGELFILLFVLSLASSPKLSFDFQCFLISSQQLTAGATDKHKI